MEGTHCTLQLHKPITELCYISFYLPRGEVRGFSYKGTVTLDRSNKGFHNCYQVREGSDIISLSRQPNEHPGDIFFKQTPTKDILTELYKLTAERERLLADLLSSDHILGITMGNQEGKLPELSVSLAPEDDCFQSAGGWQGELPVGSLNKRSTHGNRKPRRFGGRRERFEELPQKRTRRKGRGGQEAASHMGKEQVCPSSSLPSRVEPQLRLVEQRADLFSNGVLTSPPHRRESCPPDILGMLDTDVGFGSSGLGRGVQPPNYSSTEAGEDGVEGPLRWPPGLQHHQIGLPESQKDPEKHPEVVERARTKKSAEWACRTKPVCKVVAQVQDLSAQVQRVVTTPPEAEEGNVLGPAPQADFIPRAELLTPSGTQSPRHWGKEREHESSQPSARDSVSDTEGAVNKVLLKGTESEKLDEATEEKRLGLSLSKRAPHGLPGTRSKKRAVPCRSFGPDSPHLQDGNRRPSPPASAALGTVFNNSSPQSGTHTRTSPVPSPLSPRRPSPQQHHRILRLAPLPGEREAALHDSAGRKSGVFPGSSSADTLEPPSSAKVTETKGASPASLRAGQAPLVPEEPLEKSLGPGKTTAGLQPPSPPGTSADGLPWDCFSEQTTKDLPNRDGSAWVLGYRTGPACPFLLHEEREKPNRSELYLDLHSDQSPTEQDDRTPGRLQAVWPPPKTKDAEEKVGLKYTEAEYQAAILHLKREHKEEIENLQGNHFNCLVPPPAEEETFSPKIL
nr:formin-1 isoform X8 [Oryctolagus cuniculus]